MLYAPELLPVPRYACDHAGVPRVLTDAEQGVWESLLARRTCRSTSTGRRPRSYRAGHRTCGVHALPLAEFAVYFAKGFPALRTWQRAHHWERYTTTLLTGPRVAVVGLCGIGREVVALFTALRTVLCCPLTPETRGLVGPRQLAKLPPHAVLINVARGGVVDESALVEALAAGELAGACLDVFATEPLPPDSPLWDMDNVIVSPHSASTVASENTALTELFVDNLRRYLLGAPLRNVYRPERGY